ncbi:MAG: T9SS type A sorting domain-containing protein [Ignavibacteria bacterium]|nr:T9SS type A sorting domain-containing protein [Ignavibacteria bacterium]
MTSFTRTRMPGGGCEGEASGEPGGAYNYMRGFKKDGTSYLDPSIIPPRKTKFIFSGDPETNDGWTRNKGYIYNCNGADTGTIYPVYPHDAQFMIGMGADNLTITPGDTQRLYLTQMIRKGFTNENSVTKLKQYADKIKIIFKNYIQKDLEINCSDIGIIAPENYYLSQNYPNPFNASTTIRFDIPRFSSVKLYIYDIRGREVSKPVNGNFNPGYYTIKYDASKLPSGIYFYRLEVIDTETSSKVYVSSARKMAVVK